MELEVATPLQIEDIQKMSAREQLRYLWAELQANPNVVWLDVPTENLFEGNGLYHRKATYPAGVLVIGRKHRLEHFNHMASGKCLLWTSDSQEVRVLEGPCTLECGPDVRKVAYVIEEMTWTATHVTDKTSVEDFERDHMYPVDYDLDGLCGLDHVEPQFIEGA